jgi:hypothetical protein
MKMRRRAQRLFGEISPPRECPWSQSYTTFKGQMLFWFNTVNDGSTRILKASLETGKIFPKNTISKGN